jgi:hypothetical protein
VTNEQSDLQIIGQLIEDKEHLQAENAQMVAFIAAFDLWLEGEMQEPCNDYDTMQGIDSEWNELKAQHGLAKDDNHD